MAIDVETMRLILDADSSRYSEGLSRAKRITSDFISELENAVKKINAFTGKIQIDMDPTDLGTNISELERKLDDVNATLYEKQQELERWTNLYNAELARIGQTEVAPKQSLTGSIVEGAQKEFDQLVALSEKYARQLRKLDDMQAGKVDKSAGSGLSKEMDRINERFVTFNQNATGAVDRMTTLARQAKEVANNMRVAASAAANIPRVTPSSTSAAMPMSSGGGGGGGGGGMDVAAAVKPAVAAAGPISKTAAAMSNFGKATQRAGYHGQSLGRKFQNFFKSMIVFRSIFYMMSRLGEGFGNAAVQSEKTRAALDQMKNAGTSIINSVASVLIPVIKAIAPILDTIAKKVMQIANVVAQWVAALLGQTTYQKAIDANDKWGQSAVANAKKAKASIMGFDELHVMEKPEEAGASTLGTGAGFTAETAIDTSIVDKVTAIKEKLRPVFEWIKEHKDIVVGVILAIVGAFLAFKIVAPVIKIVQGISAAIQLLGAPVLLVVALVILAAYLIIKNWDAIKEGVMIVVDYWVEKWQEFKKKFSETWAKIREYFDLIVLILKTSWKNMIEDIKTKWENFKTKLKTAWETFWNTISGFFSKIGDGIKNVWNTVTGWITTKWENFRNSISTGWEAFWGGISSFFTKIGDGIKSAWTTVTGWIGDKWDSFKKGFTSGWEKMWGGISTFFSGIWDGVKKVWSTATGWIEEKWDKFSTGFTTAWEKTWNGIKDFFRNTWNGLLGIFEKVINGIIRGLNKAIGAINSIQINVPSWLESLVGVSSLGFNLSYLSEISIPRAATGDVAVPNKPYLAMLGDNTREKEVVSPLSTMVTAFKQALSEMQVKGAVTGGSDAGNITVVAQLDGQTLFKGVVTAAQRQAAKTGRPVVITT